MKGKGRLNKEWRAATNQGDLEKVRSLLERGTDVNAKDEHGQTALMNAAHAGRVDLVRLLVAHGAALDVTAKYNLSALMLAIISRHLEVAQVLIESGAEPNVRSTRSFMEKTALSLAEEGGLGQIVVLLEQKGAIR